MESLMEFFPIALYCLAIALTILLMVFIVKLMNTVDRVRNGSSYGEFGRA